MGFAEGQGSDVAGRQANRRLGAGIGVSLLLHALVLALRFGVPGSGGEAGGQAISVRIAATEPDPAPPPLPDPPAPPPPLPSAPPQPAAATGMRLIPPRPPAAPPLAQAPPAPVKPRTPSKARRVSSPAPRAQFEEPPRLIAQDSAPNDFLVDVPQPQEAERKTVDPLETQHGGEQGMENTDAQAQAEQEREEQQRLAEAQRQEAQRVAEQAERERQQTEQVAAQRALELQAEQERLARERSEQERLAQQEHQTRDQLEQQRLAEEQAVRQRAEQERLLQQERLAQERLQRERLEQERLEQQRLARERQQQERLAQERLEQQRLEQERAAREQAERERLARQGAAQRSAPAPDDPFAAGPGAGGAGGNTGSGSGAGRLPRDLSGPELKDRARELVKGLDLLKGAPPPAASGGKRRVVVGAAERDVPLRLYVDSWRMKIERTGAVHGPKAWASAGGGDPLVNVTVRSDGTVEDVTIIRSSGRPDLDDKVRQIVRLNARYAQFPPNIAARYDVIDIRRIWRFDEGLKLQEELP